MSLRGRELRMLALRGTLSVNGQREDEVVLTAGQQLVLNDAVVLEVVAVVLPPSVLALRLPHETRELWAESYALVATPALDLVVGHRKDALASLWSTAEGWSIQVGDAAPERMIAGRSWRIANQELTALSLDLHEAGAASTALGRGALTIVARHTSVHLLRPRREPVLLDGLPARILSEVAIMGRPVAWSVVAREIWPDERDERLLRLLWDRTLWRLRVRLREQGVREDLVRTDGRGNVEILLLPGDVVRDEA